MTRFALVLLSLGVGAAVGHAGMMPTPWSYSVTVASDTYRNENGFAEGGLPYVSARTPNGQAIYADFTNPRGPALGTPTQADGDRAVILAKARLVVLAGDLFPGGTWGDFNANSRGGYTVTVRVTDGASGQFDDFAFRGLIEGPISFDWQGRTVSRVTNTIVGPSGHDFRIGSKVYALDDVAFTPFGEPEVTVTGDTTPRPGGPPSLLLGTMRISETPEPATAALACVGLAIVALRRRVAAGGSC